MTHQYLHTVGIWTEAETPASAMLRLEAAMSALGLNLNDRTVGAAIVLAEQIDKVRDDLDRIAIRGGSVPEWEAEEQASTLRAAVQVLDAARGTLAGINGAARAIVYVTEFDGPEHDPATCHYCTKDDPT